MPITLKPFLRGHTLRQVPVTKMFQICRSDQGSYKCILFCRVLNQDAVITNLGGNFLTRPSSWFSGLCRNDQDSTENKTLPLLEVTSALASFRFKSYRGTVLVKTMKDIVILMKSYAD